MKISKSLNGDSIKFIVRNRKKIVGRFDELEEAETFVKESKLPKKEEKKRVIIEEKKPKSKKRSFFKK